LVTPAPFSPAQNANSAAASGRAAKPWKEKPLELVAETDQAAHQGVRELPAIAARARRSAKGWKQSAGGTRRSLAAEVDIRELAAKEEMNIGGDKLNPEPVETLLSGVDGIERTSLRSSFLTLFALVPAPVRHEGKAPSSSARRLRSPSCLEPAVAAAVVRRGLSNDFLGLAVASLPPAHVRA
jgi:hypothetical protein